VTSRLGTGKSITFFYSVGETAKHKFTLLLRVLNKTQNCSRCMEKKSLCYFSNMFTLNWKNLALLLLIWKTMKLQKNGQIV
jgi:hypothetical protein